MSQDRPSPRSRAAFVLRLAVIGFGAALLAGCATAPSGKKGGKYMFPEGDRWGEAAKRRYNDGDVIPPGGGRAMIGKPYNVDGRTYTPKEDPNYDRVGMASWYGVDFHGRDTANGEVYDRQTISAAHPTLPLPSYARVTNLRNGRSIVVRVNDRGPYVAGREIDLSEKAADLLGYKGLGVAKVRVQYVGPASVDGSDQKMLASTLREDGGSVTADRTLIARAEGGAMPRGPVEDKPIMVARLETKPQPIVYAPHQPVLPPVAPVGQRPQPQPVVVASRAPVDMPQAKPRAAEPYVPSEILAAVRPQAKPVLLQPQAPMQAGMVAPAKRRPAENPDDSLPAGWIVGAQPKSYAASDRGEIDAIFARLEKRP